ncbi:hypothetical protein QOZ80_9BG0706330 [Eleusine coracana subsp. coracana]|nr:hypothetical protein QOZ80_9BG0706330 [Eleusine coracana subsp. coracana]
MEHVPASSKEEATERMFMCSDLYIAAFKGQTDVVIGLLTGSNHATARNGRPSSAARVNDIHPGPCCRTREVTADGSTLLHIAAGQGHVNLIAKLCHRDSGLLSWVNSALDTPLHSAAKAGHAEAIETIVRLALDYVEEDLLRGFIGGKNRAGDTALHVAARHGHGAAVEMLMNLGSEMASELNGAGMSPLYLAVMSRSVQAVEAIVGYKDASAAGPTSQNALHAAVLQSAELVSLILRWRPELATDLDANKSSPLHYASSDGDYPIVKEILTYAPASTSYLQDSEGLSALHVAATIGNDHVVRLLLKVHPASADIRDNQGRTFLHAAAMRGHASILSDVKKNRMLDHLLNEQDIEGNTALHLAVQAGEYDVISKLLSSTKVQSHIMNNAGLTPSDLIETSKGFYSMVRLVVKLFAHGSQFKPQRQDHIQKWSGQDIMKWRETTSKNLAIVSTLVATIAFSAVFNVPGSYGSDGKANLNGNHMYNAFVVLDTIAVSAAVMATILLVYGRASRSSNRSWLGFIVSMHFLWLSLLSMMLGFFTGMAAVTGGNNTSTKNVMYRLMYAGLYVLIMLLTSLAMPGSIINVLRFLLVPKHKRHDKRRISRQYPFALIYAFNILVFVFINTLGLAAVDTTGNLRV